MKPYPSSLQTLTAHPKSNATLLHWRTATELNNDYMTVEHSRDGRRYTEIDRVLARVLRRSRRIIALYTKQPAQGLNYYRLRQVDYDGQHEYHGPVTARFGNGASVLDVFPTATADELTVGYQGQLDQDAHAFHPKHAGSYPAAVGLGQQEWAAGYVQCGGFAAWLVCAALAQWA